jgi:hypothetical protein
MVDPCQQRVWIKILKQSLTYRMDLLILLLGFYKLPLAKDHYFEVARCFQYVWVL